MHASTAKAQLIKEIKAKKLKTCGSEIVATYFNNSEHFEKI